MKILSENQFSGKTYFYTIASSLLCATPGQSEDDAIRQELLWQQQLLERDKEIHEKEKLLQRMQTEIAEAEMKKVMDGESNRQMM